MRVHGIIVQFRFFADGIIIGDCAWTGLSIILPVGKPELVWAIAAGVVFAFVMHRIVEAAGG